MRAPMRPLGALASEGPIPERQDCHYEKRDRMVQPQPLRGHQATRGGSLIPIFSDYIDRKNPRVAATNRYPDGWPSSERR